MTVIKLVLACVMLMIGSDWLVDSSSLIASKVGISEKVIGLTIVAMGTSLPELLTSINATRKGMFDLSVGNVVGSNIFNILIILGVCAVMHKTAFNSLSDTVVALISTGMLLVMGLKGNLGLVDGIIMLLTYAGYMAYLFIK